MWLHYGLSSDGADTVTPINPLPALPITFRIQTGDCWYKIPSISMYPGARLPYMAFPHLSIPSPENPNHLVSHGSGSIRVTSTKSQFLANQLNATEIGVDFCASSRPFAWI